jgi:hypothetical protein
LTLDDISDLAHSSRKRFEFQIYNSELENLFPQS